jgi:hypothetical protein
MKALYSCETSETIHPTTQRHIPEDLNPQQRDSSAVVLMVTAVMTFTLFNKFLWLPSLSALPVFMRFV